MVGRALREVNSHKSAGLAGAHPAMMMFLALSPCEPFKAFSEMNVSVGVPFKWMEAVVVPIHKKGGFHSVAIYHPVNLISDPRGQ